MGGKKKIQKMEVVSARKRRNDNKKTTKLTGDGDVDFEGSAGIKVISKKKIENTTENYEKIKEKFDRIEHLRVAKEKEIEEREMLEKNVLSMIMQGFGISAFTSRFSDSALLKFSTMSLMMCFYLLSLLTTLNDFLLLQIP